MHTMIQPIDSPERMSDAIRRLGIVPFFHNAIKGWSIEELTAPGYWFGETDEGTELGPWDWKIDVIREGDIAYGKFIRNKAAFATTEWYSHLMNWRRSLPEYRMALGEDYSGSTMMDRLYKTLSPILLAAIKENGSLGTSEMRRILQEKSGTEQLKKIGGSMEKYLLPNIKRTAVDFLNLYLEMGTWTVIGDFTRVYRGPNLEYSGWQRCSITTPDALFANDADEGGQPFWARIINEDKGFSLPDCTPEESRELLISHMMEINPDYSRQAFEKII